MKTRKSSKSGAQSQRVLPTNSIFRLLVESAPNAIVVVDHRGAIVLVNAETEKLFGYSRSELLGQSIEILVPEAVRSAHLEDRIKYVKHPATRVMGAGRELHGLHKDGHEIPLEIGLSPLKTSRRPMILASITDITERKRLQEAQVLLATVVESATDAIVAKKLDGTVLSWNKGAERLFGYSAREMIGQNIAQLIPRDRPDEESTIISRLRKGERVEHYESVRLRKDGTRVDVSLTISPLRNEHGTIVGAAKIARDITDLKRFQEQLAQSSKKYREVVENATDIIYSTDASGVFTFANPASVRVTGYSVQELIGLRYTDLILPEHRNRVKRVYLHQVASGESTSYVEFPFSTKSGEVRWFGQNATTIHDSGVLTGFHIIARDITERKQIEDRIRMQASILDQIHNSVISTTLEGRITYWNKFAEQLYGWKSEEVVGKDVMEVLVPEDLRSSVLHRRAVLNDTGSWDGRTQFVRRDGKRVDVHVYSALLKDVEGNPIGRNSVSVDISDRLRYEQALRSAEERYRSTLENMSEGCQIIDFDFQYVYINEVAARHGRRTREELFGHTMTEMYPGIENSDMFARLKECMGSRAHIRMENEFAYPDGSKGWFDIRMEPVPEGVFILSTDITNEKRLKEELAKHREHLEELVVRRTSQLEAANKELEAFSYSVSHDLRAPLRAVDGFVRILDEEYGAKLDPEAKRLTGIIRSNAANMGELIDDLLQFSRTGRTELRKSRVDMKSLALEVVGELKNDVNGRCLTIEVAELPPAQADYPMMKIVFTNLIANAVKFTKKKPDARIEIGHRQEKDEIIYYVKDNGAGFDMDYVHKLFGVFQRLHTKDEFEGTGIGLGIVKRIVQKHDGRVWAEGVVDGGATFYFAVPMRGDQA